MSASPDRQFISVQRGAPSSDDARVATITIDRPPINLYDGALLREFEQVGVALAHDKDVGAVVVRSAVPGFWIAHFDVAAILRFPAGIEVFELAQFARVCELFRSMPKLTIAVIEGRVGGGGSELAMSFDVRYAARETAIFNQPEVALGILPGGGGTQRLPRLIGRSRAMEVILGCEDIDATTAEAWGWVNRCFPADEVVDAAMALARRVASLRPTPVGRPRQASSGPSTACPRICSKRCAGSSGRSATTGHGRPWRPSCVSAARPAKGRPGWATS